MIGSALDYVFWFQVSGVRTKRGVRRDAVATKSYLDVEDLEVYRMLNGLEKTLERKLPDRERRWQVAEESSEYGVSIEQYPQGWPISED